MTKAPGEGGGVETTLVEGCGKKGILEKSKVSAGYLKTLAEVKKTLEECFVTTEGKGGGREDLISARTV